MNLQNEEPVRLVSQVSVCCPWFYLQSLGVIALLPIERLQQARCANVHRLKRAQLQPENLAEFLMIINLEDIFKSQQLVRDVLNKSTFNRFNGFIR